MKEYEVFYEEKIGFETYRFYYDEDLGEVEIHCVYSSGDRDSISIPIEALNNFINKLKGGVRWIYQKNFGKILLKKIEN